MTLKKNLLSTQRIVKNNSELPLPIVLIETLFLIVSEQLQVSGKVHTRLLHLLCDGVWASFPHSTIKHFKWTDNSTVSIPAAIFLNCKNHNTCATRLAVCLLFHELRQPTTSKTFTFSLYMLSSTTCCSLVLNRPPIMCRQNTFSVSTGNTSPFSEEPELVDWKGFIITIVKFWRNPGFSYQCSVS